MRYIFLSCVSLVFVIAPLFAQKAKQTIGINAGINYSEILFIADNGLKTLGGMGRLSPSPGGSLGGSYNFYFQDWLSAGTGANFLLVRSERSARREYSRSLFIARVPLEVSLKPISWLALEGGLGTNFNLAWNESFDTRDDINPNDFNLLFFDWEGGMRFFLTDELSLGLSFYKSITQVSSNSTSYSDLWGYRFKVRYNLWEN